MIQKQVDGYPELKKRVVSRWGCYMWQDTTDKFDINSHFLLWPKKAATETQLQEFVGNICSRPMVARRPQWEIVLIPSIKGWGLLLRAHHLLASSIDEFLSPTSCGLWAHQTPPLLHRNLSTIQITKRFWEILTTHLKTNNIIIRITWLPNYASILVALFLLPWTLLASSPKLFLRLVGQTQSYVLGDQRQYLKAAVKEAWDAVKLVIIAPYVVATEILRPVENVPLLRAKVSPGYRVLAWTPPVTKEFIARVANAAGASEVHVVLAACAGTLRHLFIKQEKAIPESVSAMVPVTVGGQPTPAFALVELPTGEWDPCARLRHIRCQLEAVEKRPLNVVIGALVVKFAMHLFPQPVITLALNFLSRRHPVTVCCVETPAKLVPEQSRFFYWRPPQGNTGLTFTLLMGADEITLAVASNQQVLPKPGILTSHFSREISAMALGLRVRLDRRSMPRLPSS